MVRVVYPAVDVVVTKRSEHELPSFLFWAFPFLQIRVGHRVAVSVLIRSHVTNLSLSELFSFKLCTIDSEVKSCILESRMHDYTPMPLKNVQALSMMFQKIPLNP